MLPIEYQAIESFAKGLKQCFEAKLKDADDNTIKEVVNEVFSYVNSIIDLHLQMKELDVEKTLEDMQKKS